MEGGEQTPLQAIDTLCNLARLCSGDDAAHMHPSRPSPLVCSMRRRRYLDAYWTLFPLSYSSCHCSLSRTWVLRRPAIMHYIEGRRDPYFHWHTHLPTTHNPLPTVHRNTLG